VHELSVRSYDVVKGVLLIYALSNAKLGLDWTISYIENMKNQKKWSGILTRYKKEINTSTVRGNQVGLDFFTFKHVLYSSGVNNSLKSSSFKPP
jgi:hypothetical protein